MLFQLLVFPVHREEILWLRQRQHQLLLLLAGVPGDMHVVHGFINDLRAKLEQAVDNLCDHFFISGDRIRRDKVVRPDVYVPMAGARHTGERAQRLALAARGDKRDLFRRIMVDVLNVDQYIFRCVQVAQLERHLCIVYHTAP